MDGDHAYRQSYNSDAAFFTTAQDPHLTQRTEVTDKRFLIDGKFTLEIRTRTLPEEAPKQSHLTQEQPDVGDELTNDHERWIQVLDELRPIYDGILMKSCEDNPTDVPRIGTMELPCWQDVLTIVPWGDSWATGDLVQFLLKRLKTTMSIPETVFICDEAHALSFYFGNVHDPSHDIEKSLKDWHAMNLQHILDGSWGSFPLSDLPPDCTRVHAVINERANHWYHVELSIDHTTRHGVIEIHDSLDSQRNFDFFVHLGRLISQNPVSPWSDICEWHVVRKPAPIQGNGSDCLFYAFMSILGACKGEIDHIHELEDLQIAQGLEYRWEVLGMISAATLEARQVASPEEQDTGHGHHGDTTIEKEATVDAKTANDTATPPTNHRRDFLARLIAQQERLLTFHRQALSAGGDFSDLASTDFWKAEDALRSYMRQAEGSITVRKLKGDLYTFDVPLQRSIKLDIAWVKVLVDSFLDRYQQKTQLPSG